MFRISAADLPNVLSMGAAEGGDAAAEVTRYLLGLGHRTVHHIAGPQWWWAARERRQNWLDTSTSMKKLVEGRGRRSGSRAWRERSVALARPSAGRLLAAEAGVTTRL